MSGEGGGKLAHKPNFWTINKKGQRNREPKIVPFSIFKKIGTEENLVLPKTKVAYLPLLLLLLLLLYGMSKFRINNIGVICFRTNAKFNLKACINVTYKNSPYN
ncbi:UNVERIFIED_CONTAM: hypothetical protein RMT77_003415 [Armadillidium vulgare]